MMRPSIRRLTLLAALLWACSDDDGPTEPPPDDGLPEFPSGDTQLSADLRTEIAAMVADAADASGASADPEAAGVIAAVAAGFLAEGRVTGVDASSASLMVGRPAMRLATGTWGVFGAGVAVYPDDQSPVSAYYTAVIALHGNEVALGVRKAVTLQQIQDARSDFPDPIARGMIFEGSSKGWEALTGYMQVIGLKSVAGDCAGTMPAGVSCQHGTSSVGLEILTSAPMPFGGNGASGARQFVLGYGDVRGYAFDVDCSVATFC